MPTIIWVIICFVAGSLPFSVWVGRLFLHTDIRTVGDANPGATNVLRAGGKGAFAIAALLDGFKGAIPIWFAYLGAGVSGWGLVAVAIAPVFGHAFSPFLRFRGGKAVATTFGTWGGLTVWEGPVVLGLGLLLGSLLLSSSAWTVMLAMVLMLLFFLVTPSSWNGLDARPEMWIMLAVWLLNMAVLIYKHRSDLAQPPRLRARNSSRSAP